MHEHFHSRLVGDYSSSLIMIMFLWCHFSNVLPGSFVILNEALPTRACSAPSHPRQEPAGALVKDLHEVHVRSLALTDIISCPNLKNHIDYLSGIFLTLQKALASSRFQYRLLYILLPRPGWKLPPAHQRSWSHIRMWLSDVVPFTSGPQTTK